MAPFSSGPQLLSVEKAFIKAAVVDDVADLGDLYFKILKRRGYVSPRVFRDGNSLVDSVVRDHKRIDIVVNNAATNIAQGPAIEMTDEQFDKMVEVNLKSAHRLIRLVAPGMCDRGAGSIINIASISGLRPQFHGMLYSMTKAALIMMTMVLVLRGLGQTIVF